MEESGNQNQTRFIIAAALSLVVLIGWSYLFAPTKPATDNANVAANANTAQPATPNPTPTVEATPTPEIAATTPDTTPNRSITIKSPLYEVTLDSRGAVATSWIILRSRSEKAEFPIYADGSTAEEKIPLQLISERALQQTPREIPFRLETSDQGLTALVNDRNYQVAVDGDTITLAEGEERRIEFTLTDGNGVEVKKAFVFRADSYVADLSVDLKRGGQPVADTKMLIGASIGDHAINNHNFYHIESEAVAAIGGDIFRHQGNYAFTYDEKNRATLSDKGAVDWAGVGDAYFAMVAIPAAPSQSVDYRAEKFQVQTRPFYYSIFQWILRNPTTTEDRHLVSVYLPISTDGSVTKIFTGTKDYFLLSKLAKDLSGEVGRPIEISNLINFSNYSLLRPITSTLSIPILYSLNFIDGIIKSYGWAIVIFTFLFYSLLFPLRWSQSKSFKKASGNAPKMKEIQDKIKDLQSKGIPNDDPRMRALQMEQLKLTKDALPIGGCLPMLLQFPLLIAFYTAVTVSIEARQATFLWLPDLSAADPWHVLEFAFAISMILSMKFTPTTATVTPEQQMQQKMMTYFMPLLMLYVLWAAPSGLLLYWFVGNIVSFGQQMVINRFNKPKVPPGTEIVDTVPKNAKTVKTSLSTI